MALMPAGAFAVHQLRYELAYGGHAGSALAEQGHAYLGPVAPVAATLLALGFGAWLAHLARAWRTGPGADAGVTARVRFLALWGLAAGGLLAVYCAQELLEGLLAPGHPCCVTGVFAGGGVLAVPLSVAFGGLIALAARGAAVAVGVAGARLRAPTAARHGALPAVLAPRPVVGQRATPLARALAGRAPPCASPIPMS